MESRMSDLREGEMLGNRYKIATDRELGEGAFGSVMEAEDTKDAKRTKYAIKKVLIDHIVKDSLQRHIKNEISIMRIISHPNIVNLQDVFYSEHNIYLVLELATGGDLFEVLNPADGPGGPMNEKIARKYFQQLICAVDYCHSKGVCHRDIKPENLLLDSNNDLKICDFGLSTLRVADGVTTTQCGTPNYVAPEVLHTDGMYSDKYDPKVADIWTCGVMLYVFVTACLPFDHEHHHELWRLIKNAKYDWPRGCKVSEGCRALVKKILAPDPNKRATTEEIMEDDWFKINFAPIPGKDSATPRHSAAGGDSKESMSRVSSGGMDTMNAFELLSRTESFVSLGQDKSGGTQTFQANTESSELRAMLEKELAGQGFSWSQRGEVATCDGNVGADRVRFTVEARPVIDEVSVVIVKHKRGEQASTSHIFESLRDTILGLLESKSAKVAAAGGAEGMMAESDGASGEAALSADLMRVSDEVRKGS